MAEVVSCDADRLGGFVERWRAPTTLVSCGTDQTHLK